MDKAAFANFIRHLLFLFIFLKTATGIILLLHTQDCKNQFFEKDLIPISLHKSLIEAIELTMDIIFTCIGSIAFLTVIIGVVAFYGAIFLYSRELVNCAAGGAFALLGIVEILTIRIMTNLTFTFDQLLDGELKRMFDSVNWFHEDFSNNHTQMSIHNLLNFGILYDVFNVKEGWSEANNGTVMDQVCVDFMQMTMQCCGYSGRMFWETAAPKSCCPAQISDKECTLAKGFNRKCIRDYKDFRSGIVVLKIQTIFFAILSIATALSSLYLSYLNAKYPDGNYQDDYSSDEEDDEQIL